MLSHTLQFALLLAMFTNLTQHTLYMCWQRRRRNLLTSHTEAFCPAYLVASATVLIMVNPSYLVLKVAKKVEPMSPWTTHTVFFCTVMGYVLLTIGMVLVTDTWTKLLRLFSKHDADL